MGGGKVPDGLDTAGNKHIRHSLGAFRRHGDDAHEDLMGPAELGQLRHIVNRLALVGLFHFGPGIERRQDVQAVFVEALIGHQGLAQLTGADKDRVGGIVIAQELLDIIDQRLPEVADLGAAAVGDHCQILAHLHLAHAQGIGQGGGGNMGRRILRHTLQIGQISRQALQNGL